MRSTSGLRTWARALRPLPVALVAVSCGVGGVLGASAAGGGGGGGGSRKPPPPVAQVAGSPGTVSSNLVRISYSLRDPQVEPLPEGESTPDRGPGGEDDPRVRVFAEWQPVGATVDPEVWFPVTPAVVPEHDGDRQLGLGDHTYVWNTVTDLRIFPPRKFTVRVRVRAEYEDTAGIERSFRLRDARIEIDSRLAGTLYGAEVEQPSDIDNFPVDLRPDGTGFLVADLGANTVERVDDAGLVRRILGFGVSGNTVGTAVSPGVVRLPNLSGVELDAQRNLVTNHTTALLVTNQGPADLRFGSNVVPPFSVEYADIPPFADSRDVRLHPSGAYVFLVGGRALVALNPRDTTNPGSMPIVLAGQTILPGTVMPIAGGGSSVTDGQAALDAEISDANGVAIGPDGEIYVCERSPARIRVVNPNPVPVVVGGTAVAPGTIVTVAGNGSPGYSGDGGPAASAQLDTPQAIDVSPSRALFIADRNNVCIRLANLGAADVTFAETTVTAGGIETVIGRGTGGVGAKARDVRLSIPNSVCLDANGNVLIADGSSVVFVNGETVARTSYGKTAGAARTARVYDASRRAGSPLTEPRALLATTPDELWITDRATVRVMNLTDAGRVFGGASARAGEVTIVGGGAVPGYGGDGGSARSAAFSSPSALARQGARRLFVADTGNQRIRCINIGDPSRTSTPDEVLLGRTIEPGEVDTVVGGAPGVLANDGDGLPATQCSLRDPTGVAVDSAGLLWVVDSGHHRIRVVNPGSASVTVGGVVIAPDTISTVIGTGIAGVSADGAGPWMLSTPLAVTVDEQDVVYFSERGNPVIRCFNPTASAVVRAGITVAPNEVRTLVGTGTAGNSGDGGDGPSAQVYGPRALAVYSRSDGTPVGLFFSDEEAHVVRMLNLTTDDDLALSSTQAGIAEVTIPAASVLTVAGGPNTPGFPNPGAFSGDGEVADRVRFNRPFGVAVTTQQAGSLGTQPWHFFVADRQNDRIRRFAAPPLDKTNQ